MRRARFQKPVCICGAWDDPGSYGGDWDRSEDWCPLHGGNRQRTLARCRQAVKSGRLTEEEYREIKAK